MDARRYYFIALFSYRKGNVFVKKKKKGEEGKRRRGEEGKRRKGKKGNWPNVLKKVKSNMCCSRIPASIQATLSLRASQN